jgi:hypothetical protein
VGSIVGSMSRGVDAAMGWVLRSSFAGFLERSMLLLIVAGRRTGRRYLVPVQFARRGAVIWVLVGDHRHKTWWRNLAQPAAVELWWHGRRVGARARAVSGADEPALVDEGLRAYLARFPMLARRRGLVRRGGGLDRERLQDLVARTVMVRVLPDASAPDELVVGDEPGLRRGPLGLVRRHPLGAVAAVAVSAVVIVVAPVVGRHRQHQEVR